ncbi:protein phosphatase 2C domain-containing protein [Toxoplasma gondii ME49]|uniref:Protein phosphatase 2C domain-containing protein n=1 Tax=Toxoplasma gondii (strain ATCC 50611 / Me49) TaxID=508771 RepID=S8GP24_TOXGM|nr:protein phosphatase 2C domain-containing protein [Toxoplasma gondii ME49]EPT30299.1 protein phosphatase 2C domain-containing protein [Toxoplasma gondii ME49]|eukprot:XP_018637437.1 protein phosphatase 2C domain-containing protein [Toxoplasma gondii ME49]
MRGVFTIAAAVLLSLSLSPTGSHAVTRRQQPTPHLGHDTFLLSGDGSDIMVMKTKEWHLKIGTAMMRGRRRYFEDACVVTAAVPGQPNVRIQAVFDGHGGPESAQALAVNLQDVLTVIVIVEHLDHKEEVIVQGREIVPSMDGHFDTIQELNSRFTESAPREKIEIGNRERPFKLHVVNVGDSRAMLVTGESYAALTRDHVPDDPGEWRRIEETGDQVVYSDGCARIRGLAMSRSFGDFVAKEVRTPSPITAKPDIRRFYATWNDVLLLYSDGLHVDGEDWRTNFGMAKQCISSVPKISDVAVCLLQQAYGGGSSDNITVLATKFRKFRRQTSAKLRIFGGLAKSFSRERLLREENWSFKLQGRNGFSLPMF